MRPISMISYAQNFEDVMLWRALGHVEHGFYIDLGAQDPLIDSVSLAFHEHGWTGIHVEPTPHYAQLLRNQRPGDTVLEAAVGDGPEILAFFEIPDSGISTADPKIAEQHRERGFKIREITVPCVRLSSIFKACEKRDIHWMKVDVEGFEFSALKSWGKAVARPWIVIVESTLPMTQIESHQHWEPLLLRRGYMPVYFDGLNRYYVSQEKAELKQAFSIPPNVFDNFSVNGTASTNLHRLLSARHEASLAEMSSQLSQAKSKVDEIENNLRACKGEYEMQTLESSRKLDARKDEVIHLEQNRARREEEFGTLFRDQSRQVEALLAQLAVLEKEAAAKFLDWQHKAVLEREQLSAQFLEREKEIGAQQLAIEQRFTQQLDVSRVEAAAQILAIEREAAQKFEVVRRDAERERRELVQLHEDELSDLKQQLLTREREFGAEMRLLQEHSLESQGRFEAATTERMLLQSKAHSDEVLALRKEAQALEKSLREQFESRQKNYEQHAKLAEDEFRNRELALRTKLNTMQHDYEGLMRQTYDLSVQLNTVRSSFSWRLTAPARVFAALVARKKTVVPMEPAELSTTNLLPLDIISLPKMSLSSSSTPLMEVDKPMQSMKTNLAPTSAINRSLHADLFASRDEEFVRDAYRLVLRREVDAHGRPYYLSKLKNGETRISVLTELRFSSEGKEVAARIPHMDAELAIASGAKAIAATFDELMGQQGLFFVRAAYLTLLGREPDTGGKESYLSILRSGAAKVEVLAQLRESAEGRSRKANVAIVLEAVRRYKESPEAALKYSTAMPDTQLEYSVDAAPTISDLLACDAQNFVRRAFWVLLGRWPEPEAFRYYVKLVGADSERLHLLAAIGGAEEAVFRAALLDRIDSEIRRYLLGGVPIIGAVAQLFMKPIERRDATSRGLRAMQVENATRLHSIEQEIYKRGQTEEKRFNQLDQSISQLQQYVSPQISQIQRLLEQSPRPDSNLLIQNNSLTGFVNAEGRPTIYYYVDHTISCQANTGLQRTVRMLAKSLLERHEKIRFVKWDSQSGDLVLISRPELEHLSQWNGVNLKLVDIALYSGDGVKSHAIEFHQLHEGCWLLVPEVTHINFHDAAKTFEVLDCCRLHGLRSAFLFYDAIPLNRNELAGVAQIHLEYMGHLQNADLVLPISEWSKTDFLKHVKYQSADSLHTYNNVCALPLPCESILSDRVIAPAELKSTAENMILSVGSVTLHKNQLTMVRAFNSYCSKNPDSAWALKLVGHIHPDVKDELARLVGENYRIILLPGASDEELKQAYASCAFTVFPSIEEGFGLPIGESLWFGKPCVCANFGAMAEVGSKEGCISIDTRNEGEIEEAIKLLIENNTYRYELYDRICNIELNTWNDYADQLIFKLRQFHLSNPQGKLRGLSEGREISSAKKRIFWLGMHKILVRTELVRLRELGYEVFNPKYLSEIVDQSAELDWDGNQQTSLPGDIFNKLASTNFFYTALDAEIYSILNEYFDAVIVTIAPIWLEPIVKGYRGKIIYRVYGQAHSLTNEFLIRDMRRFVEGNENFIFMPHASEAVLSEENWFRENELVVPYCLTDDIFGHQDSWSRPSAFGGEVALTCPNIANPFFGEHYQFLKKHYDKHFFRFYGVQTSVLNDDAVVGTLPRRELIERWRNVACYIYTYDDPQVCYLPPIEMMVIGVPVLFVAGSLLDKYFAGINTPARFRTPQEALHLCEQIRNGNEQLIDAILVFQKDVRKRYAPAYVWPIFDRVIQAQI
jgi:FkbM family methyltransferase